MSHVPRITMAATERLEDKMIPWDEWVELTGLDVAHLLLTGGI